MSFRIFALSATLFYYTSVSAQSLSWTVRNSGTIKKLRSVAPSTPAVWVAVGDGGTVLRSTDGGRSWGAVPSPAKDDLHGVAFQGSFGLAVGVSGTVIRSTDSGESWSLVPRPTSKILNAVAMSTTSAIAVGEEGTFLHSTDDGAHWTVGGAGVANQFFCVSLDADTAVAGSYGGAVASSLNGGGAWGASILGGGPINGPAFYGVSLTSGRTAIMVGAWPAPGDSALILRSDNDGITWRLQSAPSVGTLFAVAFPDPQHGYVVGDLGTLLTTADTGNHWSQQSTGVSVSLNGVAFAGPDAGVAVGDSGTILQASPGSATGIIGQSGTEQVEPAVFQLSQNYPNPFNPSTTIAYEIPERAFVTLTVYNMLGQHVARLVNTEQESGAHTIQFDGSWLSSGVYFYHLEAGNFVATKKMALVK